MQDTDDEAQISFTTARLWSPIPIEDLRFWFFNPGTRLCPRLNQIKFILP